MTNQNSMLAQRCHAIWDRLSISKAWKEWLEEIEREFRYFRIKSLKDKKDALLIYGGREIVTLKRLCLIHVQMENWMNIKY